MCTLVMGLGVVPNEDAMIALLGMSSHAAVLSVCEVAIRAGQAVMSVYAQDECAVWHKSDASPLTEADMCADAVIKSGLAQAFPDVLVWSEESHCIQGLGDACDVFFLVDPLDGTREFVSRSGEFTVNIALVYEGVPVLGVVFAPALGELFFAAQGVGACYVQLSVSEVTQWLDEWRHGLQNSGVSATPKPLHVRGLGNVEDAQLRVIASRSHACSGLETWLVNIQQALCAGREGEFKQKNADKHEGQDLSTMSLVSAGSSLKFCRVAQGRADVYPRLGSTCQWDTAAADAILSEAGGCVLDVSGTILKYGLQHPTVNPHFIAYGWPAEHVAGWIDRFNRKAV